MSLLEHIDNYRLDAIKRDRWAVVLQSYRWVIEDHINRSSGRYPTRESVMQDLRFSWNFFCDTEDDAKELTAGLKKSSPRHEFEVVKASAMDFRDERILRLIAA